MRTWRTGLLLLTGFLLGMPAWGQRQEAQRQEMVNGRAAVANEVLVRLRPGVRLEADGYLARAHGIRAARELDNHGLMHLRSGSLTAAQLLAALKNEPEVEYAEPNYLLHTTGAAAPVTPNDPLFLNQWALQNSGQTGGTPHADIDATQAWSITTGTASVVVGVVDTGLDYTHPDLRANVWSAPAAFTVTFGAGDSITCPPGSHGYDAINNVCDPMDQNGHGTHVSGTIGAAGNNATGVTGVNWTTSIIGLRFLDASGSGSVAGAVRAITFAIQARAALGAAANIRVLSNSWGGTGFSQSLQGAITQAGAAGMLFVAAAGNNSSSNDTTPFYPAAYRVANLIAVAATDANDALASFSNYGRNTVDLGAPGTNIASTLPNSSYGTMSGTSMATPHVSGAAALLLAGCTLDTPGLRAALVGNVDPLPGLTATTVAGGRLNVYRALAACSTPLPPKPGFTLSAAATALNLSAGGASASTTVGASATGGFTSQIALAVTGLPAGVSATLTPASIVPGGTATLALSAAASAAAGTYRVTITGASGTLSGSTTVSVTVSTAPSFKLSVTPASQTVKRGAAAAFTIAATASGGFSGTINLQVSGLPPYSMTTFSPTSGGLAMKVSTTLATNTGTYTIKVVGTASIGGKQVTQTATATLTVN